MQKIEIFICNEVHEGTLMLYHRGCLGGIFRLHCKNPDCNKVDLSPENTCPSKPADGNIKNCPNYEKRTAASSRKAGPRPGHNHSTT
jgi:hypothetical protein